MHSSSRPLRVGREALLTAARAWHEDLEPFPEPSASGPADRGSTGPVHHERAP